LPDEYLERIGKTALSAGAALGSGGAGAAIGTVIFPGVGTAVGYLIGIGSGILLGNSLGKKIVDKRRLHNRWITNGSK